MSYSGIIDIQALIPQREFGADTTPTTEQVLGFIRNRSADLDSMLAARGYSTPIDLAVSPYAYAWCLACVSFGAAADAEASAVAIARVDDREASRLGYLVGEWERMTKALLSGDAVLTDATAAAVAGESARTRGGFDGSTPPWTSRKDAYAPSYAEGRQGGW